MTLEKDMSSVTFSDDERISVTLTQEETLAFDAVGTVKIQIRVLLKDGSALASDIVKTTAEVILKDGEI